jgi:hypothetical protein
MAKFDKKTPLNNFFWGISLRFPRVRSSKTPFSPRKVEHACGPSDHVRVQKYHYRKKRMITTKKAYG